MERLTPRVWAAIDALACAEADFDLAHSRRPVDRAFAAHFARVVAFAHEAVEDYRDGRIDEATFCAHLSEPGHMLAAAKRRAALAS